MAESVPEYRRDDIRDTMQMKDLPPYHQPGEYLRAVNEMRRLFESDKIPQHSETFYDMLC